MDPLVEGIVGVAFMLYPLIAYVTLRHKLSRMPLSRWTVTCFAVAIEGFGLGFMILAAEDTGLISGMPGVVRSTITLVVVATVFFGCAGAILMRRDFDLRRVNRTNTQP